MTVDEAVTLHTQRILLEEGYITRKVAKEIAEEAVEATKDEFSHGMTEMSQEIDKIRERTDRLFDEVQQRSIPSPPTRWTKFWRMFAFWRK